MPELNDVVIVGGARTPQGKIMGQLASLTAVDLGSHAIAAALERSGVAAEAVELGRHPRGPHDHCGHLRDELRGDARTGMGPRVSVRPGSHGGHQRDSLRPLQEEELDVTGDDPVGSRTLRWRTMWGRTAPLRPKEIFDARAQRRRHRGRCPHSSGQDHGTVGISDCRRPGLSRDRRGPRTVGSGRRGRRAGPPSSWSPRSLRASTG